FGWSLASPCPRLRTAWGGADSTRSGFVPDPDVESLARVAARGELGDGGERLSPYRAGSTRPALDPPSAFPGVAVPECLRDLLRHRVDGGTARPGGEQRCAEGLGHATAGDLSARDDLRQRGEVQRIHAGERHSGRFALEDQPELLRPGEESVNSHSTGQSLDESVCWAQRGQSTQCRAPAETWLPRQDGGPGAVRRNPSPRWQVLKPRAGAVPGALRRWKRAVTHWTTACNHVASRSWRVYRARRGQRPAPVVQARMIVMER